MAIVDLPGIYLPPSVNKSAAGGFGVTTGFTLDATGEKAAFIVQAPKTGNIRKLMFYVGSVTSATDTDVRLETVDLATGNPSGTLFGTTTNVTVASASITANSWITTGNLTADAAVTKGDFLAIVIAPSGTPNYQVLGSDMSIPRFPYAVIFTTAWFKSGSVLPVCAVEYDDGSYAEMPGIVPANAGANAALNTGTTPDEAGLLFQLPVAARVTGCWVWIDLDEAIDLILYDSDGTTVLASHSHDKDLRVADGSSPQNAFLFNTRVTLRPNTDYRLVVKPTTVTTVTLAAFTVASAALLDIMPGGQDFRWTQRTDAGAWTDTATKRPFMGLIIDGIEFNPIHHGFGWMGGPL